MRFDDSLETVLSADMSTPFGAQSAWRQLVDLIGRRRAPASASAISKLRSIRAHVPPPIRAASARAVAFADPPAALVRLFVEDELTIATPVLRTARLRPDEWIDLLPVMSPPARSILRHRRDLPPAVNRALENYGSVDFVLPMAILPARDAGMPVALDRAPKPSPKPEEEQPLAEEVAVEALSIDWTEVLGPIAAEPDGPAATVLPSEDKAIIAPQILAPAESSFVSIASVARGLPVVAEAMRQTGEQPSEVPTAEGADGETPANTAEVATLPSASETVTGTFQISELVARIDAYQRQREDLQTPMTAEIQPALFELESVQAHSFRFETDASGVVRWIEGAARAPLIGLSLDVAALPGGSRVDGVVAGAFRRRAGFADARLVVDGDSDASGQWRITGIPVFDRESGRFTGYRGTARRPRSDEMAEPRISRNPASDALRQLVHELRTPTNAIAGFAEMIEAQMLGPVPEAYRLHAGQIRTHASGLLGAIDDIDMAARIESKALDLRPGEVPVTPLLERIAEDLAPLATLRGAAIELPRVANDYAIAGDDRAVERLIGRLMATLVASAGREERVGIDAALEDGAVVLVFDRPTTLAAYGGDSLLTIDAESEADREGAPLLGTGFALRLARNLAGELHGSLVIGDKALTLRLPAAVIESVEQVSSS